MRSDDNSARESDRHVTPQFPGIVGRLEPILVPCFGTINSCVRLERR